MEITNFNKAKSILEKIEYNKESLEKIAHCSHIITPSNELICYVEAGSILRTKLRSLLKTHFEEEIESLEAEFKKL